MCHNQWKIKFQLAMRRIASALNAARQNDLIYMTTKPTTWILEVQEDPETGDLFLEFPPDLMELQGWTEGTVLNWDVTSDGEVSLTEKAE
jgi:hypothetical protein